MADTIVLVGTAKGLFRFRSSDRLHWRSAGPDFPQTPCYTAVLDPRSGVIHAGINSEFYGASIRRSSDLGATWDNGGEGLSYGGDDPEQVTRVWAIAPAADDEPLTLYAGVEASGLFRTRDGGDTWTEVRSLREHPTHELWMPGYGGKCLHTVVVSDSQTILTACSAGGAYRTLDAGESFAPVNENLEARFMPEGQRYPIAGQCVHKVSACRAEPRRLWLQNHGGVYRSDDGGSGWQYVGAGLPGDFGFPVLAHPRDPDTAYVVPLQADGQRWAEGGALCVWRTQDAGASWHALASGLPQRSYASVLRDGLDHDGQDPIGLYFGTTSGSVYASADGGRNWQELAAHLPRIFSVRAAAVPS